MANQLRQPNLGYQADSPWRIMLTFLIRTMTQTTLGEVSGGPRGNSPTPIGAEYSWHFLGWAGRRFLLLLFNCHLLAPWLLALGNTWHWGA